VRGGRVRSSPGGYHLGYQSQPAHQEEWMNRWMDRWMVAGEKRLEAEFLFKEFLV